MHKSKLLFGLCPGKRAALHRAFGHAAHTFRLLGSVLGRLFNQEYARVAIGQALQNGFAVFLCDLPRRGGLFPQQKGIGHREQWFDHRSALVSLQNQNTFAAPHDLAVCLFVPV